MSETMEKKLAEYREIARYGIAVGIGGGLLTEVLDHIDAIAAQLAAAERDAARYRYLRDDGYGVTIDVLEYDDDGGEDWVSGHSPADLDEAIDRFMQPDNGGIQTP